MSAGPVSASAYLHSHASTSSSGPDFTQDELRLLILEYLSSSCYADSARAFASEWAALGQADSTANQTVPAGPSSARALNGFGSNGSSALRSRMSRLDGMDGVEHTPPPEERVHIALTAASPTLTANGNGKAVAFEHPLGTNGMDADSDESDEEDELGAGVGVLSSAELRVMKLRRNIRNHILYGRIQNAVDLLHSRFPAVLDANAATASSSAPPKPSLFNGSSANAAEDRDACDPHKFFTPPPLSLTQAAEASLFATSGASPLPVVGETFSEECISLEPTILGLNLQLQIFIECMRAAYTSSAPSTPTSSGILPPLSSGASDGGMSGSTGSLSGALPGAMHTAIVQSQKLQQMVRVLPAGKLKEGWRTIAIDVAGLLAYKELRDCPVRGYMAQSRRETLAELVNAALLKSQGQTPLPLLALVAKQASAVWEAAGEFKVPFPPQPPGVKLDKTKRLQPSFDLATFLAESDPIPLPPA